MLYLLLYYLNELFCAPKKILETLVSEFLTSYFLW